MNYEYVKEWKKRTKQRSLEAFGKKCGICGYDKCQTALEFHHINSEGKEFSISQGKVNNWNKIVEELRKCICVCSNCHREIHGNIIKIPENISKFDENFSEYRKEKFIEYDICPICEKSKRKDLKFCSYECRGIKLQKIDWEKINLQEMIKTKKIAQIAKELGVSWTTVKKKVKICLHK